MSSSTASDTPAVDLLPARTADAADQAGPPPLHDPRHSPRVVCIHGAMDRGSSFAKIRKELRAYETIAYDRRGYAGSVALRAPTSFRDHVADLVAVLDGEPAVLFGHSYGGVVACAVAAEHPELVTSLVAYEAPMSWMDWWPASAGGSTLAVHREHGPAAAAEAFMRRIVGDKTWEGLDDRTRSARRAEGAALVEDLAGLRNAGWPFAPDRIAAPVTIAYGEHSLPHQQRGAIELATTIAASRGRGPLEQDSASLAVDDLTVDADDVVLVRVLGGQHGAHRSHPRELATIVELAVQRAIFGKKP